LHNPLKTNQLQQQANRAVNPKMKSCFSEPEMDSDLKLIIERWLELSIELRKAIVKMVW
jgi:hypothetical protein